MEKNKVVRSRRKNLAQYAYKEIRNRIYFNQIKPGELIKENNLAEELGISRTPVREAIKMLASEDLIEVREGVGTFVKILSFKDIRDIFEVRKALEAIAVKSAINRITESDLKGLEDDFNRISMELEKGKLTREEFTDVDMKVHELIFNRCENSFARGIFEDIKLKIKQYQFLSYESLNNSNESILQHLEIINLLRKKDLNSLITTLNNHIDWSLKCFLMYD
ncbi:GntR family transcriptional regulator [Sedimentibacter sp. MB31-C6]|uniref:GntR family transcriptional regulator n=1 Tax=Sedimentibacter sp. MB31-C6 TaxID=3109366 RepID=UPI002DDC90E2|nr:GntR family transcriptional regulator [Sedimentibacter sp. MB36-C1]WSI03718.1 GntR family transcriptional regulator [Sedimentibacter sp. MB36-C1]